MTCAPGTHYVTAGRCIYCGQRLERKALAVREPTCHHCQGTRVAAFVWVGPGPTLTDWRPVPCPECSGTISGEDTP